MSDVLKQLIEAHKQIEISLAAENAQNAALVAEKEMLQSLMITKIRNDLLELLDEYKQLGIQKSIFHTNVELNPLNLNKTVNSYHCIGIGFSINKRYPERSDVKIYQIAKSSPSSNMGNCYEIYSTKDEEWFRTFALNSVYVHWKAIKQDLEKAIIEAYFEEQNRCCEKIKHKRVKLIDELKEIRESIGVRR